MPAGWKPVAYRAPVDSVDYILNSGKVSLCDFDSIDSDYLIVEKIKPREITLVETDAHFKLGQCGMTLGNAGDIHFIVCAEEKDLHRKIWKLKEE